MTITLMLIIATVGVSYLAFNNPALRAQLLFHPATIKARGEYYRFFTHGFIHADFNHLLFNMYALYIFGNTTEQIFSQIIFPNLLVGKLMYLVFYLAAIGAASQVTFARHQNDYGYSALGASGGVSALMWPYILIDPWNWFIFPPLPAILLGPIYLIYSNYMDRRGVGNVGHNAHLWGAIFGLLFYLIIIVFRSPELLQVFFVQLMNPHGPAYF